MLRNVIFLLVLGAFVTGCGGGGGGRNVDVSTKPLQAAKPGETPNLGVTPAPGKPK